MLGTANIKARPLRLALMVDPNSATQVRDAIRLASSLWGGAFFPIVPVHKRSPASWRDGPVRAPLAANVVRGYLDGFDPDLLVQFGKALPSYVLESRLKVVKQEEFWSNRRHREKTDPKYGIGVRDLLFDIYQEHFKFRARFPIKAILPRIPKSFALFWVSVFGEYPPHIASAIEKEFSEALELSTPQAQPDNFLELTEGNVVFPRRITQWATNVHWANPFGGNASIFFMDATRVEDIIDFWNLRAHGGLVLRLIRPEDLRRDRAGYAEAP